MNKLTLDRKAQVIKALCEGNSIRSTARITGTAINTVVKLLKEVGAAWFGPPRQGNAQSIV
jgi:transposase-like protein